MNKIKSVSKKKKVKSGKNKLLTSNKWVFLVFVIALVLLLVQLFPKNSSIDNPFQNLGSETNGGEEAEKIEISGIEVNDFYKESESAGELGEVLFVNKPEYNITYYPLDDAFLIIITRYPFDEIRPSAEEEFLKALGINKTDACKLSVYITTPSFANPDRAGEVYELSFCNDK